MTKTLFKAALAATVATGLFATPALAANSDTKPFTATAKIVKPLTLTKVTDLDFGTITMGAGLTSSDVSVAQDGTPTCGSNLTCVGAAAATFTVAGVALQGLDVTFNAPTTLDDLVSGESVAFSADVPSTVTLNNTGAGSFGIGGTITVLSSTDDGTYSGDLDVTVTYQ